ncbi:MAG: hypothetical protein KC777_16365 [Cyanobacteria bacterium HKST-UBA02]|nr:hypothetical protein [Cyanobacteria bacterium HKST-UBA02]
MTGAGMRKSMPVKTGMRSARGSILPLIAFLLALTVAFLALTIDVMRSVYTCDKLQSAVESAGLAAMCQAGNTTGTAYDVTAQNNVINRLQELGGSTGPAWNQAPAGPASTSGPFDTDITFDTGSSDLFYPNPDDPQEFFLRVTARRDGADSLSMFFLPAIYAFNTWAGLPVPPGLSQVSPYRSVEVISQPARRIGAGLADPTQAPDAFSRTATFPFAVGLSEFETARSTTGWQPVNLVSSTTGATTSSTALKGAFVNVARNQSGTGDYHGQASGSSAVDELMALLDYFNVSPPASSLAPGVVEKESMLSAFDPAAAEFKNMVDNGQLPLRLQALDGSQYLVVPVVLEAPSGTANQQLSVAGFARLRLRLVSVSSSQLNLEAEIGDAAPVFNATVGDGSFYTGPARAINADSALFAQRIDPAITVDSLALAPRQRGIVLAPSISPRPLGKIKLD